MASCWSTFFPRTTARLRSSVNTALCWKDTVTDGTAWADWTIGGVERRSTSELVLVQRDSPKGQRQADMQGTALEIFRFFTSSRHCAAIRSRVPLFANSEWRGSLAALDLHWRQRERRFPFSHVRRPSERRTFSIQA